MRKITRKGIVRKLDNLIRDIVVERDKRCVCCGTSSNLQPGHLFTRQVYRTRWDFKNVYAQCSSCNLRHEYDPFPLTSYFLKRFGGKEYDKLHTRFWRPKPMKTWELIDLYEKLEKLRGDNNEDNRR